MSEQKIEETKEYTKFKKVLGNRRVTEGFVKRLAFDIEKRGQLVPILVNKKMEVIDGQHRLSAIKRLEIPVKYIITEANSLEDVHAVNSISRSWLLQEWCDSYIERGFEDYEFLKEFAKKNDIGLTTALKLTMSHRPKNRSLNQALKEGGYEPNKKESAEETMKNAGMFYERVPRNVWRDQKFIRAIEILTEGKNINWEKMKTRVESYPGKLYPQVLVRDYLHEIEKIYIHGDTGKARNKRIW